MIGKNLLKEGMTELERFIDAVEKYIAAQGISPTRFGKDFAGDPLFVFDLRKGREPRSDTRTRILEALSTAPTTEHAA